MRGQSDPELAVKIDTEAKAQFASLGVDIEEAPNLENEVFEVWQSNWKALMAFLALRTQWRVATSLAGVTYLGIDYNSAGTLFKGKSLKKFQALMAKIAIMEAEALPILNMDDA